MSIAEKFEQHKRGRTGFALTSGEAEQLYYAIDEIEGVLSGWDELMCCDPGRRSMILHGMRDNVKIVLFATAGQLRRLHRAYDKLNSIMNGSEDLE